MSWGCKGVRGVVWIILIKLMILMSKNDCSLEIVKVGLFLIALCSFLLVSNEQSTSDHSSDKLISDKGSQQPTTSARTYLLK